MMTMFGLLGQDLLHPLLLFQYVSFDCKYLKVVVTGRTQRRWTFAMYYGSRQALLNDQL